MLLIHGIIIRNVKTGDTATHGPGKRFGGFLQQMVGIETNADRRIYPPEQRQHLVRGVA
jgi:hypothetical protein